MRVELIVANSSGYLARQDLVDMGDSKIVFRCCCSACSSGLSFILYLLICFYSVSRLIGYNNKYLYS